MADLSPAAQAVLDAAVLPCTIRQGIAAALRALADQLTAPVDLGLYGNSYWAGMSAAETKLRAIAAELEA
jgi:hypothetical protein